MGAGVLGPKQLPASSRIKGYDKELRMKGKLDDIYEVSSGIYSTVRKKVPNTIRMVISDKAKGDSNNITVTMMDRLQGMGIYDPDRASGSERRPSTKTITVYRNIVRKVVTTPGYGPDKLDAEPYGLYKKWVDELAAWNKDHHGLSIRQAVLEQYGESLVHGRTLGVSRRNWNANILVGGLGRRTMQVAYNTDRAQFTTDIVNRIVTSGGGSLNPLVTQTLNMPNLSNANLLAIENRIEPLKLDVPGGKGWVLTMSEIQATYLGDPVWSTRNLGSQYVAKAALPKTIQEWRGVLGMYKQFVLIVDEMQPTLVMSGTNEPWGISAGYLLPGDDEDRERDDPLTRDTANILGKAAIVDWEAEKLRHIRDEDDYEYIQGHGTAKTEGIRQVIYDQENPVDGSHEQYSSMVMILGLPDYV